MEGIDDLEFCTVFGNLMDNAIEAERKVTEKKEIIIFVEEKWMIFVGDSKQNREICFK